MTLLDSYYPFDSGTGATATVARWRAMARLWSGTGIIPNYLNQCAPTLAGSALTIDTGGVWIDGFYGENDSAKNVAVSGSGMMVARLDPTARDIVFIYVAGQTAPTQTPTGIYEIPIARITSGAMTDIRQFASAGNIPSGVMWDFAGGTAPSGWLLCDGSSYLRTDYANLFNAIGTTWGAADGTHFSVPDSRGRVGIGAGAGAGLVNRALAGAGGEENHILTSNELAVHNHAVSDPTHAHSVAGDFGARIAFSIGTSTRYLSLTATDSPTTFTHLDARATGISIGNAGANWSHNNMQPFIVVTKIIKT